MSVGDVYRYVGSPSEALFVRLGDDLHRSLEPDEKVVLEVSHNVKLTYRCIVHEMRTIDNGQLFISDERIGKLFKLIED